MTNVEIVYPEPHEKQQEILDSKKRFNHLQCGRRFGKTELIKELCDPVIYGYPIGIFCPIERDFLKIWDELCSLYRGIIKKKNETYHTIELLTGGTIHMWSMKAVDNGRGEKYKRVILDEFAKAIYGKKSWEETIRATLTDLKGDAWFLSTPKGRKNYFCILKTLNKDNPDWGFHKYTSYDNPYLDKEEIDSAKSYTSDGKLSPAFRQEYLADDVDANEMPFLYCFDESKHVSNSFNLDDSLPLWLSFDFNVMPQTCSLGQRIDSDTIKVRKLIRLDNASIYDMCNHIKLKYRSYYWIATGDATGKNRSGTTKGNLSYWAIIKKELSLSNLQIKLRSKNLDHTTSQIICNSVLTHKTVVIHEECKELIDDCIFASTDEHGKLIKSPDRGLHFLDCFTGSTLISTISGNQKIKDIEINQYVLTRKGYRKVIDKWSNNSFVYEWTLSDGTKIECTRDHKFYVNHYGFIPVFVIFEANLSLCKLNITESYISKEKGNPIFSQLKAKRTQRAYIDKSGLIITEKYRKDIMFIIKMKILLITILKIWDLFREMLIRVFMLKKGLKTILSGIKNSEIEVLRQLRNGINLKRDMNGILKISKNILERNSKPILKNAYNVEMSLKHLQQALTNQDFAQITANQHIEGKTNQILSSNYVSFAEKNTNQINTIKQLPALDHVRIVSAKRIGIRKVYDITIEHEHEFFANGILAHNCFRYLLDTNFPDILKIK